jgi:hypothetical protein
MAGAKRPARSGDRSLIGGLLERSSFRAPHPLAASRLIRQAVAGVDPETATPRSNAGRGSAVAPPQELRAIALVVSGRSIVRLLVRNGRRKQIAKTKYWSSEARATLCAASRRLGVDALDHGGDPLPDADTHGDDCKTAADPLELAQGRQHDARSGRAKRMTDGDGAAIRVQSLVLRRDAKTLEAAENLSGESFFDLDDIHSRQSQSGPLSSTTHRRPCSGAWSIAWRQPTN